MKISKYTPTYVAENIYEVDVAFYKKLNIKVLLLDLDNTLASYKTRTPSARCHMLIKSFKENGIRPIITSNNNGNRVKEFANDLGIECLSLVMKPFKSKLLKMLKELNINKDDCMIIGDQLLTDIKCGYNAKIKTLFTNKLVIEDSIPTRINRIFEKRIRARLEKCGKLINWKSIL